MRAAGTFAGVFALVLAVLLAAVGQLGRIDRQTFAATLAAAAVAAGVAVWRNHRAGRNSDKI